MTRLRQPRARPEAGAGALRGTAESRDTETETQTQQRRVPSFPRAGEGWGASSLQILVSTQLSFLALPGYDTTEKFVIMLLLSPRRPRRSQILSPQSHAFRISPAEKTRAAAMAHKYTRTPSVLTD